MGVRFQNPTQMGLAEDNHIPGSHWSFAKRAIPVGTEHLQRLMHNVPTEAPVRSFMARG
jgi:hypothetical protein